MNEERFIMKDGLIYDLESKHPNIDMGRYKVFELLTDFYEENQILKQYTKLLNKRLDRQRGDD